MKNQVNNLLRIIRYSPLLIILIISILVVTILINEQKREIQAEKINIEKQFLQNEKERIKLNINTVYTYVKLHKKMAEKELKEDLKSKINNVYKIMSNIYINNKDKKSKNEIIQQIKEAVDTIRYDNGNGYFSIFTLEGINLLQPIIRSYEGTNLFNRKDFEGNYPVQKAISIAKTKGEGFFNWYSIKPKGGLKEFEKTGIVKKFEPYGLIITTGVYKEDFLTNIKNKTLHYISQLKYKNNGYVYIITFDGKVLYHPSEKAINGNIFDEKRFTHINSIYKDLILKKGIDEGDYLLIKPKVVEGKDTKDIKITYAKKFDDWEWVMATNFKLSDAHNIIENMKIIQEKKYQNYKKDIIIYGLIFTILLLIISYYISKLIENKFLKYKKNLEKQIKENIEQRNTLLKAQEVAHIGDWKLDLKTNKAYWSKEMTRIFGVNKKDKDTFGIKLLKKIMIKEDMSCFENSIHLCIETGAEHQCIYRIKRNNDEIRWIDCRGRLEKDKSYIIGTVQDITESKILEIEKKQKDELLYQQSKMAAMGEMLGNIAHQWRQPLSTISTASTGAKLQKEMNILTDEQLYKSLTAINDSAQYLSQTIDDFRGFFNPKYNIDKEFYIEEAINKTLKLVNSQFNAKDIELIENIENYKLISIQNELIQVLINILNNARDALVSKEKQRRLIFINSYKKDDTSYIEILDNAGGIKEDNIDRIFEPYFTTKHESQGTGIGLYMSQDIINNHLNGSLIVSNEKYIYEGIHYTGAKFIIQIAID